MCLNEERNKVRNHSSWTDSIDPRSNGYDRDMLLPIMEMKILSRYSSHFFSSHPFRNSLKRIQQTINHWFWRNSLKGPVHLSQAGNRGAVQAGD